MSDPIPAKIRKIVTDRAEGMCEWCGKTAPLELHHRKFRSRGGKHTVTNLVALCGWGNHTGCHGDAHTKPAEKCSGFTVSSWDNEVNLPVLYRGILSFLLPNGTREEVEEPTF